MCGRFTNRLTWRQLRELYGVTEPEIGLDEAEPELPPRYNIAPTQVVPVVRAGRRGGRELALLRWGLIPWWAREIEIGARMINAKAETVAEQPAFRNAFQRRRCLVPADGFYEWQRANGSKQPYLVGLKDGAPFAMAGLWERWDRGDPLAGEPPVIESFTIITGPANALVAPIHDRMPVILAPADYEAWLASPDLAIPQALLQPYPAEGMTAWPVSRRVNSVKYDDAECAAPVETEVEPAPAQAELQLE
jgi:putative SOS response-associated peptidase YedK